jgi:hypothetical protein
MLLVKGVRRTLFWFVPQVDSFCAASIEMAERQLVALETIAADNVRTEALILKNIEELRTRQTKLEASLYSLAASGNVQGRNEAVGISQQIPGIHTTPEEQKAGADALLWMESVKWRAGIGEVSRQRSD